ncbi:MAG TPA: UDP-3-O-(3-hydroxymyristoyl)glucosamine N-acyltransferase [bacterium]|jgi:UDP-3-O-[3-hydroxymyristoyl] glucosamine N-acyltransferase
MKLRELAEVVGGRVVGDGDVEITSVSESARASAGALVMIRNKKDLAAAEASGASALLLSERMASRALPAIVAPNLRLAFALAIRRLHPSTPPAVGVHPTAVLGAGVAVGRGAAIGPHVVVGDGAVIGEDVVITALCAIGKDVTIGAQSVLHPLVTIYDGCQIGRRVILHAGAVIGGDGFGFARDGDRYVKIPHVGRVVIEDDVEIGVNTAVDRATLGETRIGEGSKIDNLVQVGHNVTIGRHVVIAGMSGIAGSATIEDGAVLAGNVGIVDHVTVGAGATLMARAAAHTDVPPGAVMSGSPALSHREDYKILAMLRRLPEVFDRLLALERSSERPQRRPPPDRAP